jgi:hypothetical protein
MKLSVLEIQRIVFKPYAEIFFTTKDLEVLTTCSQRHYDGYCKSISSPGAGSFLYGWVNRREIEKQVGAPDREDYDGSVRVDSHQLDTLRKVLEIAQFAIQDEETRKHAYNLSYDLGRVFARLNESHNKQEDF